MCTYVLNAVGDLPLQGLHRASFNVFVGKHRLAFGPALDSLEKRAGLVPVRFTRRLRCIQMDMRLDERRDNQPAFGVQHLTDWRRGGFLRIDTAEASVLNRDLP